MKKLAYLAPLTALLLISTVFAISFRADGGTIATIGTDTSFISSDVHFSAWSNGGQGAASLQATGVTPSGSLVRVYGNYVQTSVIVNDATTFSATASGTATYWKKGILPKKEVSSITYTLDKTTNLVSISGSVGTGVNLKAISISGVPASILVP